MTGEPSSRLLGPGTEARHAPWGNPPMHDRQPADWEPSRTLEGSAEISEGGTELSEHATPAFRQPCFYEFLPMSL